MMDQLSKMYKALSEEMRLRIVMLLSHGELCVCDLMSIFGEPQSKVSRHLAYLKHAGLIKGRRAGVWMHYALNESLDKSCKSQLTFMKENLYDVSQFKQDRDTLMEQKNQDRCGAGTPSKRPYRVK